MENIIGFVGYESEDIAIYLAKILQAFGRKVVITDKTEQEVLCEMLDLHTKEGESWKEGEYGGVLITNNGVGTEEADVILYLFGYRLNHPKLYECETLIMVTDGVPAHASLLRKIGHKGCKCYLLLRNMIPMRHTERYLSLLAGRENTDLIIPYDDRDVRTRCSLSAYNGCQIKNLSSGMKRILCTLAGCFLSDVEENIIREQMKKM